MIGNKFKYEYAEFWFSELYSSLFEDKTVVSEDEIIKLGKDLENLYNKAIPEIAEEFNGMFKPDEKVEYIKKYRFLRFPDMNIKVNSKDFNVKIRINPCTSPETSTKIVIITAYVGELDGNQAKWFFDRSLDLCKKGVGKIAKVYKEYRGAETEPIYEFYIKTVGSTDEIVKRFVKSSKNLEELRELYKKEKVARIILDDLSKWGYYKPLDYEKWFIQIREGIDGLGNFAFKGSNEKKIGDFKGVLYGDYDAGHELTKDLEKELINVT